MVAPANANNVLVIGSGGREHAIARQLAMSKSVQKVYVAPGNGGTSASIDGKIQNVPIQPCDFNALVQFASQTQVELVVVGPEQPLVEGIQAVFKKVGIPCFGPSAKAAMIEGSKAFSKDFMIRHSIPTAKYRNFTNYEEARDYVNSISHKVVLKASGLAAGKGVLIPSSKEETIKGLQEIMLDKTFGDAGDEVVIEEYLEGEECSYLAFTDGYTVAPMPPAQDHKRALDGDQGLNTGGMGAYAPAPVGTKNISDEVFQTILKRAVDGMRRDGYPFVGVLYAGIMITESGPKCLEFNCRFGDPETQVLLPLLSEESDLFEIMMACCEGRLDSVPVSFSNSFAATVVAAAKGYPEAYSKGDMIAIDSLLGNVIVYHAGTKLGEDGSLYTSGGRVLSVTGTGSTLPDALQMAYAGLSSIQFEGMHFRRDIGHRALKQATLKPKGATYADAGVDIDQGNRLVDFIKPIVKTTKRVGSNADIGGFGGEFDLFATSSTPYRRPLLISATDGVGTKLKIAQALNKHDSIGIDLVAMNVNDLVTQGAEPLFFLDYFACGHLDIEVAKNVISGVAKGCQEAACALVGGETAEMPSVYPDSSYDLAGFSVGIVEKDDLLPKSSLIKEGDVVLGLASSGIHSNGYSLVRHIVDMHGLSYNHPCPFDPTMTLGEALLTPTRIYVRQVLPAARLGLVKAMAHITGGGFIDNIPRVLPENLGVKLNAGNWPLPPVFGWLKKTGNIDNNEMYRTLNCGIGMILIVASENEEAVKSMILSSGEEKVYRIGSVADKSSLSERVVVENSQARWA